MKICFFVSDMSVNGGVQRVLYRIANMLSNDNDVYIYTYTDHLKKPYYEYSDKIKIFQLGSYTADSCLSAKVTRKLCRMWGISFPRNKIINYFYGNQNIEKIEKIIVDNCFDVVIALQGGLSLLLSQVNREQIKNTKLFGWVHSSYEAYFETPNAYNYGEHFIAERFFKNLDGIITLTEHDAQRYRNEFGVNSTCIYNPLSYNILGNNKDKGKHLIWCGRMLKKTKGLDYLIAILRTVFSFEESTGWDCYIAGDGPDFDWIIHKITKLGLSGRVKLLGNRDDMQELYAKSSILLSTSRWEGFGLTITEAFSFGTTVVSFENSGPKEIISNNQNGILIPKYDVSAFSNAVLELMRNQNKMERFSQNALIRANDFCIETIKEKWIKILKEGILS